MITTSLSLPDKLRLRIKKYCQARGMTLSGLIRVLLEKELQKENDNGK